MKRKIIICFSLVSLIVGIIGFVFVGKFVWIDCADLIKAGYTLEIGLGMGLMVFYVIGFFLPGLIVDFIKLCKSSGSPDDK